MHTTIKYTGTKAEKDRAAINDCKFWLTQKQIEALAEAGAHWALYLKKNPRYTAAKVGIQSWRNLLAFVGIQGYPVKALRRQLMK